MGGRVGGQGGCEWRSEALVKIQKKKLGWVGAWVGGGRVGGGQGGWEQRSEACVKFHKKKLGEGGRVGGGGFRVGGGGGRSGWM